MSRSFLRAATLATFRLSSGAHFARPVGSSQ
jgi:hypothetical protein